jgi:hypothetical protein
VLLLSIIFPCCMGPTTYWCLRLNKKREKNVLIKRSIEIGPWVDYLPIHNGFVSKIIHFVAFFSTLLLFGCVSWNPKCCFFLLPSTNRVVPFLQIKMGLMMGEINLYKLIKQKKKIVAKGFCWCFETCGGCGKTKFGN